MARLRSLLSFAGLCSRLVTASPAAASTAASSISRAPNGISTVQIVGIAVGGAILMISAIIFWQLSKKCSNGVRRFGASSLESRKTGRSISFPEQQAGLSNSPHERKPRYLAKSDPSSGLGEAQRTPPNKTKSGFMSKPEDVSKFVKFISLYGQDGVLLRELLMLASTRFFPDIESPERDMGLLDEKTDPGRGLENKNFMRSFALELSHPAKLLALRDELVLQARIIVRQQDDQAIQNHGPWATDEQVWMAGGNMDELTDEVQGNFYKELLHIFERMPGEGFRCNQRRQMELIYNHARMVGIYICKQVFKTQPPIFTDLSTSLVPIEPFTNLLLNVLTHRNQSDADDYLMEDLLPLLINSDLDHASYPRFYVMWKRAQMGRPSRDRSRRFSFAIDIVTHLKNSPQWSQGVVGFLLADTVREIESLQDHDAMERVLKLSDEWHDLVYQSRDHEAMSALCILLPQLRLWDKLARMPKEYHLDCGFHLSRLGYPELAERFLVSGFSACGSHDLGTNWRYQIELLIVTIRLGRWQEAEDKFQSSLLLTDKRYEDAGVGSFDKWQLSGEFGEFKLSISCLLADCFLAKGDFVPAELLLRAPLDDIENMRDHYIVTMRVAARSRLLHAQLQLEHLTQARETSLRQCRDVFTHKISDVSRNGNGSEFTPNDNGRIIEKEAISWVVDEILICTNELVDAHMLSGAMEILEILVSIKSPPLPQEVHDYIRRRSEAVSSLMAHRKLSSLSEPILEDAIRTSSPSPRSLQNPTMRLALPEDTISESSSSPRLLRQPTKRLAQLESAGAAAIDFPHVSFRAPRGSLQGRASDSSKDAKRSSAKQGQAILPAKEQRAGGNRFPRGDLRLQSLLRLSRLPPTPKTELRVSQSFSQKISDHNFPMSSALQIEQSNYRPTGFPLIVC